MHLRCKTLNGGWYVQTSGGRVTRGTGDPLIVRRAYACMYRPETIGANPWLGKAVTISKSPIKHEAMYVCTDPEKAVGNPGLGKPVAISKPSSYMCLAFV